MSSDPQYLLELLQNNYISLVIVTAVVYDYLLSISSEVHYVWHRPWNWVSTIFVLVRYLGLSSVILNALMNTSFIPGPVEVSTAIFWVDVFAFQIFVNAADFVMILRVYAMWNRSKRILWLLLFIYVPQVVISFVLTGLYGTSTSLSVTRLTFTRVMDVSFCNTSLGSTGFMLTVYAVIPRFVLGAMLLILALTQSLKDSIDMYKATKRWQPNQYMERLVKDGILYFLVNMLLNITSMLEAQDGFTLNSALLLFLTMFYFITLCPMMPRFIISVRELHDRDPRRGLQGVDSGFGVSPQPMASQNAPVSAIACADVAPGQDQGTEGHAHPSEAILLGPVLGDNTDQV